MVPQRRWRVLVLGFITWFVYACVLFTNTHLVRFDTPVDGEGGQEVYLARRLDQQNHMNYKLDSPAAVSTKIPDNVESDQNAKRVDSKDKFANLDDKNDFKEIKINITESEQDQNLDLDSVILPVLVIACNRITVSRNLDQLLKYRPSAKKFPIIVSQDCGHKLTAEVIQSYGANVTHIQHPDLSEIKATRKKNLHGYYKIARHYKWALNQMFHVFNYQVVIIVEDDLDIAPDFFEYFAATFRLLHTDPTLWCVSAWNDNGKSQTVADDPEMLHRTDYFPGLGWMLERRVWLELEPKWPIGFWDDWMMYPEQRRGRSCIRPEISRTKTFGKRGVSNGMFYEKYLKYLKLNNKPVAFTKKNLSYLLKENYDKNFVKTVYNSRLLSIKEIREGADPQKDVRVHYNNPKDFKYVAKPSGIMSDFKSGVPRTGYRGVVSFIMDNRRVFIAPPPIWQGYNTSWNG